jgi:tyrosine-protein phosphatase SIW14
VGKPAVLRWIPALAIAGLVLVVPPVLYRYIYVENKRLRVVATGKLYRSGQMTEAGFKEAVQRYGLRVIVNLQDEYPDPDIDCDYLGTATIKESEMCRRLGVRYLWMPPELISRRAVPPKRPPAIDRFLEIMDDPANHPVLLHCRAGLHRTGVMVEVYRQEYERCSPREALRDLKDNGFGEWPCAAANDYITQYILTYRPGLRLKAEPLARGE